MIDPSIYSVDEVIEFLDEFDGEGLTISNVDQLREQAAWLGAGEDDPS